MLRNWYFFIFALSGFSGLIYQSIWSHYLKLFLGHSAYAQTLVLVIFMGGMAIGAWLASLFSGRLRNLLMGYAVIEGIVGLFALFFHQTFLLSTEYAFDSVIPAISNIDDVHLFKWGLAAALILPQSILLGMTFPYMSAGLIRRFPTAPGYTISMLYFTNSLGAALGVLVSGFVLIAALGLPGTVLSAGLLNIVLAIWVWALCRTDEPLPSLTKTLQPAAKQPRNRWLFVGFLWVAALTGMASFMYEIAWIRMLSQVLGSSTHAFELMLSAFILGLTLGSFWIKGYIDRIQNPIKVLGMIQVLMGIFAVATIFIYGESFEWMIFIMNALTRTEEGYTLFHLSSHAIALLIMLPSTFCAGMTLPLLTHYLVTRGHGEKSIGNIYAANTFGSIIGVIVAVQWVMPLLGLKNVLLIGGAIDIGIGLLLLLHARLNQVRLGYWATAISITAGVLLVFGGMFYQLDTLKMASGVYRTGALLSPEKTEVLFQQDGKTASIATISSTNREVLTITTNGKPDASIVMQRDDPQGLTTLEDSTTMLLTAVLPWAVHPQATKAAVIGMGSGVSSQTLLHIPSLTQVDTIEIEPAMVEGAKLFGEHVAKVFNDPRSHIYIEDAKTYFTNHQSRYDIIISEPSNPWVSGVSGLFSDEFYARIVKHLQPEGVFMQWLQTYEIDIELVVSVLKALKPHFADYAAYSSLKGDLLILAKPQGQLPTTFADVFAIPDLAKALNFVHIHTLEDLYIRLVAPKPILDKLSLAYPIAPNSDFYPVLDLGAARTRYLNKDALELYTLRQFPAPLWQVLLEQPLEQRLTDISINELLWISKSTYTALAIHDYLLALQQGTAQLPANFFHLSPDDARQVQFFYSIQHQCQPQLLFNTWLPTLRQVVEKTIPYLSPAQMQVLWDTVTTAPCFAEIPPIVTQWLAFYQAVSVFETDRIISLAHQLLGIANAPATQFIPRSRRNEYVLTVALLAHLQQQDYAAAVALWQRYAADANIGIHLRLVLAAISQKLASIQRGEL